MIKLLKWVVYLGLGLLWAFAWHHQGWPWWVFFVGAFGLACAVFEGSAWIFGKGRS